VTLQQGIVYAVILLLLIVPMLKRRRYDAIVLRDRPLTILRVISSLLMFRGQHYAGWLDSRLSRSIPALSESGSLEVQAPGLGGCTLSGG